jgi:hypothetical protein
MSLLPIDPPLIYFYFIWLSLILAPVISHLSFFIVLVSTFILTSSASRLLLYLTDLNT